jgi:predicted outer membrane repeat protein
LALEDRCVPSTLTVTSVADDGSQNHTLRYAVTHAQDGDTIQLTAAIKGPIVLNQGELILSRDVTIESVPSRTPTISGGATSRIFEVAAGAQVSLVNLKISGGNGLADNTAGATFADGNGGAILNFGTLTVSGCTLSGNSGTATPANGFNSFGGAILNDGGAVTVTDSTVSNNSAANGGGIADFGALTVIGGTFSGNSAGAGGAMSITGAATVTGATVSNNTSGSVGGGIFFFSGTLALSQSTLSGNTANLGGALVNQDGTMTIADSTIDRNNAGAGGGGIFTFAGSNTLLTDSTFAGDTAAFGGAISNAGALLITGGAFAGNTALSFSGGGIDSIGVVVIDGTTFTNNHAATFGGAISSAGFVEVTNSDFVGNSAAVGGGIANFFILLVGGSDFSGNSPDDIAGGYTDLGGNGLIVV